MEISLFVKKDASSQSIYRDQRQKDNDDYFSFKLSFGSLGTENFCF
jgi:hypothetical protein